MCALGVVGGGALCSSVNMIHAQSVTAGKTPVPLPQPNPPGTEPALRNDLVGFSTNAVEPAGSRGGVDARSPHPEWLESNSQVQQLVVALKGAAATGDPSTVRGIWDLL